MTAKSVQNYRSGILLAHLVLMVAVLGITASKNATLNKGFQADHDAFRRTSQLGSQSAETGKVVQELLSRYPNSQVLLWTYGQHLAANGKIKEALTYYQKTLEVNVYLTKNPSFLYEYGIWLYRGEEYARAKQFLNASIEQGLKAPQLDQARSVLADIEKRGH